MLERGCSLTAAVANFKLASSCNNKTRTRVSCNPGNEVTIIIQRRVPLQSWCSMDCSKRALIWRRLKTRTFASLCELYPCESFAVSIYLFKSLRQTLVPREKMLRYKQQLTSYLITSHTDKRSDLPLALEWLSSMHQDPCSNIGHHLHL